MLSHFGVTYLISKQWTFTSEGGSSEPPNPPGYGPVIHRLSLLHQHNLLGIHMLYWFPFLYPILELVQFHILELVQFQNSVTHCLWMSFMKVHKGNTEESFLKASPN